jgi:hypothetical protein
VACIRKSLQPIEMEELKTWIDGQDVMKLFNEILNDLLIELGIGNPTEEKKR